MNRKLKKTENEHTESWKSYRSMKISKLGNQFDGERQKTKGIFFSLAIFVNGYTDPTAEELKEIMIANGGTYHHYYSHGKTTHIIASNLANTKIKNVKSKLFVYPKWIVDSLAASKLLDYRDYLLYGNRMSNQQSIKMMCDAKDVCTTVVGECSITEKLNLHLDAELNENMLEINKSPKDFENLPTLNDTSMKPLTQSEIMEDHINVIVKPGVVSSPSINIALNPSNILKNTVNTSNENFLTEFYANSRLHHISAMASLFKDYVEKCHNDGKEFSGWEKFNNWLKNEYQNKCPSPVETQTVIMHVDMDCFFVSVGLRSRPDLRGLPVAVTHSKGTGPSVQEGSDRAAELKVYAERESNHRRNMDGASTSSKLNNNLKRKLHEIDEHCSMAEIACCSYEARQFGIKNGMLLGPALKLCPQLKTISYNFAAYKEVSLVLYDLITSFTTRVEAVSCDEMYVDLTTDIYDHGANPLSLAEFFRHEILSNTGCCCSIGIGPNMLLARLATKKAKPDGIYWATQSDAFNFISECPLADIPGIGWSFRSKLEAVDAFTCGDLQSWDLARLQSIVGKKMGQSLFNYCRGIDHRNVSCENKRKSVSAEINYGIRFKNWTDAETFVSKVSDEVTERLKACGMSGKCITLKVKIRSANAPVEAAKFMGHGACDNVTKSISLPVAVCRSEIIKEKAFTLLRNICDNPQELRGIGIQISKLEKEVGDKKSLKNYFSMDSSRKAVIDNSKRKECGGSHSKVLDIDILNELPESLRQEVFDEYKSNGYLIPSEFVVNKDKIQSTAQSLPINDRNDQISSGYTKNMTKLITDTEDIKYSQINASFLNALPDSIQMELKHQLSAKDTYPGVSKWPVGKRGRPSGQSKKSAGIEKFILKAKSTPSTSNIPLPVTYKCIQPVTPIQHPPIADLGGETEFCDIKRLLLKWIESCDCPEDEDVEEICSYCKQLIVGRDLEALHLFLKFFRRKIFGHPKEWELALQRIIGKIQLCMKEVYKCPLKIS